MNVLCCHSCKGRTYALALTGYREACTLALTGVCARFTCISRRHDTEMTLGVVGKLLPVSSTHYAFFLGAWNGRFAHCLCAADRRSKH